MRNYYLVQIDRHFFIMLNPFDVLTNRQCNSIIFKNKEDSILDTSVFEYFNVKINIIGGKLDRRTKEFKRIEKDYQYFSVAYLPEIKRLENRKSLTKRFFY